MDVGFTPSLYFVNEDGNNVIFFINNRNPDMEREVIIEFATNDGTAIGISSRAYMYIHLYTPARTV